MNHQKRGDLPPRQMALAGFMLSGPVVHSHAVWRHPQTRSHFLDPDYYLEVARTLEDSCFDLLFFADRLAAGDQAGQSQLEGACPGLAGPISHRQPIGKEQQGEAAGPQCTGKLKIVIRIEKMAARVRVAANPNRN